MVLSCFENVYQAVAIVDRFVICGEGKKREVWMNMDRIAIGGGAPPILGTSEFKHAASIYVLH